MAVRWFNGPPLALYAAPEPSAALGSLHASLHELISPRHCHPHYRPDRFVPHCTLAMHVMPENRVDAIAFAERMRISVAVTFEMGEIVAVRPVNLLAQWRLRTSTPS